jgi:nucleotide-binding universal stress UspA family protein
VANIVVGVDGSEPSRRALRWAIEEAAMRRATVHAVYAWNPPLVPGSLGWVALPTVDLDAARESAKELLDSAVEEVGGDTEVEVGRAAVQGNAATVLLDAAADADLLVVGSRGHGGFAGLLLGSVGQQCAHHAACPVVIVPHEQRQEE